MTITARLNILSFEENEPPKICRAVPAALHGTIIDPNDPSFLEFCDRLDILLDLLCTDHQRYYIYSYWIRYFLYNYWLFIFVGGYFGARFTWPIIIAIYTYLAVVCICTTFVMRGKMSAKEIIQNIHSLCEGMSNRTPCLSLSPVLRPITFGCQHLSEIDHIAVCISGDAIPAIATEADVTNSDTFSHTDARPPLLNSTATTAMNDDYQQLEQV